MRFLIAILALSLAGCATNAGECNAPAVRAASAVCAPAPQYVQAQVVAAPTPMAGGQQMVQVQYRTTVGSYARAGLAIPGNVIVCVGNFLRCAMDALFPTPVPEASYAPAAVQYVPAPVQYAPAAAPCAPVQYVPAATPCQPPPPQYLPPAGAGPCGVIPTYDPCASAVCVGPGCVPAR